MKNGLSLVSTYVDDIFISHDNKILKIDRAGPMYYLDRSIDRSIPKNLIFDQKITINLFVTEDGKPDETRHRGVVYQPIESKIIDISKLKNWMIVSTVFDEWDISALKQYHGKICIDIQGCVRKYPYMGIKQRPDKFLDILSFAYCLKGTKNEISYIPPEIINNVQMKGIVLITDEDNIITILHKNNVAKVNPPTLKNIYISKGSGDVFFGSFISCLYNGIEPVESAKTSAYNTFLFLNEINK